jgi:imidazolonepropionase-like amidohydrolase
MRYRLPGFGVLLATLTLSAPAQEKPVAFTGAQIIPVTGAPIENGLLLVQHGKILAVGEAATIRLSGEVELIDVTGKVIMPGLVDSHSHIGGGSGADGSGPIQPETRVLDSFDVRSSRLQKARSGGITTVNVMPGSAT